MERRQIFENKKQSRRLLLLADEQEDRVDRYLDCGDLYVLFDSSQVAVAVCVMTEAGDGICELKNIATAPAARGCGYGRALVEAMVTAYKGRNHTMLVGTGDSPLTVPFYQKCGFRESHRTADFFTTNYDPPIFE